MSLAPDHPNRGNSRSTAGAAPGWVKPPPDQNVADLVHGHTMWSPTVTDTTPARSPHAPALNSDRLGNANPIECQITIPYWAASIESLPPAAAAPRTGLRR